MIISFPIEIRTLRHLHDKCLAFHKDLNGIAIKPNPMKTFLASKHFENKDVHAPVHFQFRSKISKAPKPMSPTSPLPNLHVTHSSILTALRLHLRWCTLRTLFTLNPLGLTTCRTSCRLCLLQLLLALGSSPLLLAFANSGLTCGKASLRTLRTALLDNVEGCTDDSTLVLHSTASALLGNFLLENGMVSSSTDMCYIPSR